MSTIMIILSLGRDLEAAGDGPPALVDEVVQEEMEAMLFKVQVTARTSEIRPYRPNAGDAEKRATVVRNTHTCPEQR
jgi:hypothetical protein